MSLCPALCLYFSVCLSCFRPKIAKLQNSRKKLQLEVLEDDDQVGKSLAALQPAVCLDSGLCVKQTK